MQGKKMKQKFVLLSVAADMPSEAGLGEGDILEFYVDKDCLFKPPTPMTLFAAATVRDVL